MDSAPDPSPAEAPLQGFARAHAGILSHLKALGRLPALLEPAAQAREIAADTRRFFRHVVFEHHGEEESELFPAVLASAEAGTERTEAQATVDRLVREHRELEAAWMRLEPELSAVSAGRDARIDAAMVGAVIAAYQAHARFEEEVFLPLAQAILGRKSNDLAALGLRLHARHTMSELSERLGFHV